METLITEKLAKGGRGEWKPEGNGDPHGRRGEWRPSLPRHKPKSNQQNP